MAAASLRLSLAAVALSASVSPALAQDRPVISAVFENDIVGRTDQGYTNGLKLAYMSPEGRGRRLARLLLRADEDDAVHFGVAGGQSIFTPKDTLSIAPLPDKHPYAGWLYLETASVVARGEAAGRNGPIDIFKFAGGVIGPASLAEQAQRTAHRAIKGDDVLGWDNQLHNEPGLIISFDRIWRPVNSGSGVGIDTLPHLGVSAGNVITEARGGATIRIGSDLGRNFGQARISPAIPSAGYHATSGLSWQVFAGAEARGVARNIFLDGNTWRDSLSVEKKNFVAEFQAGIALRANGYELAYTHAYRSREFAGQSNRLDFGALTLSAAF